MKRQDTFLCFAPRPEGAGGVRLLLVLKPIEDQNEMDLPIAEASAQLVRVRPGERTRMSNSRNGRFCGSPENVVSNLSACNLFGYNRLRREYPRTSNSQLVS